MSENVNNMTAEEIILDTNNEKSSENVLYTLKVLSVVREAQLMHGLRHNDYQLYRQYCSRRIRRIRKNVGFIQGDKKNFRKKEVTVDALKNERILFIPLMTMERCWAYAMQLKEESLQDQRKKFAMRNRLRKATKYAIDFERVVEESGVCDARTQLEVQGYSAWLQGTVLFELAEWTHEWASPVNFFNKAVAIYSKLSLAMSEDEAEIYKSRLQELEVKLRYCRHHLGDQDATDTLLAMRNNQALGLKLDNLVTAARERQAATLSEVTWHRRTLAVKHEKVRLFLLNEGLIREELSKTTSADERVEMLDKLLMECKDAIQLVRDDLKIDSSFKTRQQVSEGVVSPLHFLHTYLSYLRLNLTILRNLALYNIYDQIISGKKKVDENKKAPKLQDIVRLYDLIIQNLTEIPNLAGLEDDIELKLNIEGQTIAFKAHRCYYVAESFVKLEKWVEALGLYQRTLVHVKAAKSHQLEESMINDLDELLTRIDSKKFTAQAQAIIVSETSTPDNQKKDKKEKQMLIDRLDEYVEDSSLTSTLPRVVPVPPSMVAVPCKPLFFDLAYNHVDFPSLDDQVESKKVTSGEGSGITGLVRGLWSGWGTKK